MQANPDCIGLIDIGMMFASLAPTKVCFVDIGGLSVKIGLDNVLGLHIQALSIRAQRTQILAQNIANADTPGYKARDIDFQSVLREATQTSSVSANLRQTDSRHLSQNQMGMHGPDQIESSTLQYRNPLMPSLDGNTVEAQIEQAEFAQNSMQFLASLRFVNGRLSGLLSAIRGE